jgi:hypothetical protein
VNTDYVKLHGDGKKQILADILKGRIYACFYGRLSESHFNQGQTILDTMFALLNTLELSQIDYLLDLRFGLPFSKRVLELWVGKAEEVLTKYPKLNVVRISDEQSPLWLQISTIQGLLDQYEGRIIGVFKTREEADAYLDELRGHTIA